jgi:hypothetical protein
LPRHPARIFIASSQLLKSSGFEAMKPPCFAIESS